MCQSGWAQGHPAEWGPCHRAGVGEGTAHSAQPEQDAPLLLPVTVMVTVTVTSEASQGTRGASGSPDPVRRGVREPVLPVGFCLTKLEDKRVRKRVGMYWKQIQMPTWGGVPEGPPRSLWEVLKAMVLVRLPFPL